MPRLLVLAVLSILPLALVGAAGQQPNQAIAQDAATEAFRKQVEAVFRAYRAGDQPALDQALKAFTLPLPQDWIASNFAPDGLPKVTKLYATNVERFQAEASKYFDLQKRPLIEHIEVEHSEIPRLEPPPFIFSPPPVHPLSPEAFRVHFVDEGGSVWDWEVVMVMLGDSYRLAGTGRYPFWLRPSRITVGGNVQQAMLVRQVSPKYPEAAKVAGIGGTVRLHLVLGLDGDVAQLDVVSGDPELVRSAVDAVRQWRYQPTLLNGKRVEVDTFVDVIFSLTH
jgi:TonB family protein